jgi:MoaA/NifB/PqqE/SkfB family radical SAM enzyme
MGMEPRLHTKRSGGVVSQMRHLKRPPKYLPILLLFVTDRCNLRCRMCGVWQHSEPDESQELNTEEWKAVIRSAARLGTSIISFSGGEALLRRDLVDLIAYAQQYGITVHLCTNGTVLNHGNVDRLRQSGINTVSVSIESPTPEIHESFRGEGTFEKAVQGIRLLRQRAPEIKVGINYTITPQNFRHMAEMIPFAESLGVHQIKFAPIHTNLQHKDKRLEEFEEIMFKESDLEGLQAEVERLMRALRTTRLNTTSKLFLSGITNMYRRPHMRHHCYAGYAVCAINPRGMVTPCCDMVSSLFVRQKPLEQIWTSPQFHELRKSVRHCDEACWDTTNTELSLRLRLRSGALLGELSHMWRDLRFYFGDHHS